MIPLTLCDIGKEQEVLQVGGKPKVKAFLGQLGIVPGATVLVISSNGGDLILRVKESRVALNRAMAARILV